MLGNKSKPSAASSSTKKELQGGSFTSNSINNNMGGAKGASLSSGGGGGMSPTNIAAASSSSSSQQDWRKMSTADCSTNVPDQLRDIIKRYFLDPVVGTTSSSSTAAATSATNVAAAGAGATTVGQAHHISTHAETGGGRNTAASAAVNHASTPAPSAGAAGTAPALAVAFAPKDGTYATPLSSMIALTQLATFSRGNSTDADGQSGGGVFDMFDGVDPLSLAAAASSTSVALPLPAFAFANYGFFPALDHHRGAFTALAGSNKSRNDPAQSPSSSGAHHRNRNTNNSNNRAAASATFDSGATLVNSLLLSDVTQSPPPLFERGLRELISLVESSRPSSSASSVSATANVVVTGGGGGSGDSGETGAELFWGSPMMNASSSRGYLRDNFMYGAMFTSAMLSSSSGTDGGVPGGALGGGGISGSPTRQRPQQLANSSVTIVQDGSVIHRILHGALRELLAVSSTNSSSWQAAAARSLVPWWIRCIAAWEFCDANTRVTMCFNFLQACLPAEDPNHVSVVLESWSYVIKLDIASHAIYHDAAACWLQSSLEWLFLDAKASHRVSALCIISHLVRQGSAHLLQIHRAELFQALWNALTDVQSWIRELAAGTLQALLTTLLDRNYRTEQGGGVGGGGDSGMMDAGGMSSNGAGGLLRNIDMLESDSPPMSPLSADGGASLPMPNTRTTLQEEDADIRALVQRALTAFAPQQNHNLMTTFRASQHGRIMSWSGGLDDAGGNRGGGGGPMSDTGSMTDSFTAISPSAASATMMMGTSPAGSSNSGSTAAAQQQNVMHAGALVLGALLGADREIRLAHQQQNPHRPLADQAKSALDRTTDGGASTEITEHSEVEGSAEQGPDADPASGGPSAMFLPPANDHHHHHEGGGGSIGGPQLSMNSIGGSGNNIRDNNNSNTRAVTSAEMSPASLQLTAAIGTTTSGEFRTHSLAYGMAGGRNSTSGSSIVQSPVPGVPGTWSAPPGSPESLDPVLAVRHGGAVAAQPHHNGTGKSSATAFSHSPPQHSDAPVGGGGGGAVTGDPTPNNNNNNGQQGAEASWISPASAFLSDSDIRMLLMSIVVSRKKVYARIYACRLLPLLAAYHPTLFLVEYGEAALTEILGVAIHLKEAPQSSSSSLDKIHEDRGNILTSIGLLYRAISSTPHVALPPVYQQTLLDRIIPLLEEYLIAPAAAGTGTQQQSNNNNANGNVGSGGGPRQRVDAAATSLALLVGSLSSVHRGLCEDFVQTFSGIVLDAPHLTIETAGATAELYHFFPSLRRQAHAGLLRLITDSLRQSFVAAPPTQQHHSERPQLPTSRRHHVSHQRQPFSDDLLVPGAVNTRLTALYVLHNLSCNMSWSGAAMYFLDVCLPYLHHPDARVRRGCIECCGPMLAVDCTSSSFANAGENIASLNSPSASFAPWEANKSHRFSSTTYFPVSPPLGSQGILENSSWLCDHTNASAAAGASPHHPPHGSHHNGRSHIAILHRIVGRLMDVAVADPLPELRRAALHVFLTSWSYDGLIVGHTSALGDLFHILCDPSAQNRHMALSIASRVANRVPSFAAPRLRSTLANFLEDLSCLTGAKSSQGKSRLTSATPAGSRLLALQQPAMMRGGASGGDAPAVFSLTAALAGIEERLLLLFQLLHSIPIGAVMPMYLPILLQILQNVLSADSPVSSSATAVALSMVHFLLEEAPEHAWGAFMPFYILAVRHVDGNNQGKMLSALNLLQALVKCVAAVHSSNLSDAAELLEDSVVIGDGGGQEGRAGGAANPSSGQNSAALNNVRGSGSANRRLRGESVVGHNDSTGPRRSSSLLLVRSAAAQQHHTEQQQQSSWMVTEAQLQATANLLHGWMRQRTIALSASASIAIMKLLGSLTAVEPLPSQPFVPVMEGGMDGVDSRRRADAAVGLEESRVVCDGSRGWPFEILQYLLSVLAGNVVPLSEEDQRITIAAILRIFHSTPSVARHFHAFIGPFFRLLERLLSQARYKAYASSGGAMFDMDAFDANSGNAATTAATASASAGASSSTIATYVSLLETVFSAIAQLLMSPDVSRSTYAHAATIVRMARAHWDAERPALLSRLCDVLSALNRQATEPLQEYVAWFVSSLLSALVHCCPQESKRELTVKVLMSIESFRGASTSNTLLLVVPTLCQILNTPNIPDDAKRHVGKALVRFIFSCDANPFIARVVECCTFQLQISERLFEAERQRIQKQIATVFNMRDAKKRAVLEYELSQTLSEASQVAFSAVRTSSLPRILINYANIGHAEVKQYPNPPAPPSTQAEAQQFAYDVISQKAEIPIWLLPWEAEIVAVICAAAGRCKSFDEYHASMVDRLGVRFGARSDVVRFFNSCANPCSHATLQRPIAVVATSPTTMMNAFYFSQQTTAFSHQQQATLFEDAMTPTTTTMTTPIPPQPSSGLAPLNNSTRQRLSFEQQQQHAHHGSRDASNTTPLMASATNHLLPPLAGGQQQQPRNGGGVSVPQVYRKHSSFTPSSNLAPNNRSFHSPSGATQGGGGGGATTPLDFEPDPMFLRTPLVSGHQLPLSAVKNPALFLRGGTCGGGAHPGPVGTPASSAPGSPEKGMSRQQTQAMTMAGSGFITMDSQCGTPLPLSPTTAANQQGGDNEDYVLRSARIPVLQRHDNSSLDGVSSPVQQQQQHPFQQAHTRGGVYPPSSAILVSGAVNGSGSTSALLLSPSKLQYRPDANLPFAPNNNNNNNNQQRRTDAGSRTLSDTHLYTPTNAGGTTAGGGGDEMSPSRQHKEEQRRDLQNLFEQHKVNLNAAAHKIWFEQLVAKLIQRSRHVYISACEELSRRHYVIACAVFPFAVLSYLTACDVFEREEWLGLLNDVGKKHRNDRAARCIPLEIMREMSRLAYAIRRDAAVLFPDQHNAMDHAAKFLPNDTVIRLAQRSLEIPIAVSYLEEDVLVNGQWDKSPTLLELYDHASMRQEVHALRLQPNFHTYLQQNPHVITPELLETLGDVEAAIKLYDIQQRPPHHSHQHHHYGRSSALYTGEDPHHHHPAPFVSLGASGAAGPSHHPRRNTSTSAVQHIPRPVTAFRQNRAQTTTHRGSMSALTTTGAAVTVIPPRRQHNNTTTTGASNNNNSYNLTSAPQSPSMGPMLAPSPRHNLLSPSNHLAVDDESFLMNTTLGSSGTFYLQPPSAGLSTTQQHQHHHHRPSQHYHHQIARWNNQTREEQAANSASAVLRCLNQGFHFKRTLAYYHTMRENSVYRGLVGSHHNTRARGGGGPSMHPEIARHVALAAHCLGDWDAVREVCTASGVKRSGNNGSGGGGLQRYGSMSSEHGIPYPTRNFVSKELLLFSAASDVARGYYDEALETLERLRELLMDAATVLHAESSKRRMDLNLMMLSMTDLEEAMHVLRTRTATSTNNNAASDGVQGGVSLPQVLLNGQHSAPIHPRLITIGHRSLPSQASALHVMQAIAFRAAFVPRSKQLRNLFVLCELLTADGQQDRAQEVLRDSLRIVGGGGSDDAFSNSKLNQQHQRLRSLSVGYGENKSFPSSAGGGHLSPSFDPSQYEHQAITLECLKIGLETAGCSSQRLERLHCDVQEALSAVANYVEEHTMGGLVSPLSTVATNPSMTMPLFPSGGEPPSSMATGDGVGVDNSSGGPLRWTHRSSSATATTSNQPHSTTVSRGTLEFRVELETLDLEITRRLTGFHQYPTTRRGGRDAPRPSYATPLFGQDGQRMGLYMLTSEADERDLSVFISKLYNNSEAIVGEHHSVTDANFATSLKEFSLLFFDVCKALRSEWVELNERNTNSNAEGLNTAGSGDEELQVLQNFLTTSSQCVTALQRAAAMCVKSFDHATTATVHSLQQQQQQQHVHHHQTAAAAAEAFAASPTSSVQAPTGAAAAGAAGGSGLAVNIAGAGHLAYSSRRRVASARANITVSDLLLKALNTAWNGNCLHDLSLAPDMLPSWALVSPFLAHYASRSKSMQQIVTQMCQQSLGMLSQMSFHLVSSFETVGLRWLPTKDAPPGEGEDASPVQPQHHHQSSSSGHHQHQHQHQAATTKPPSSSPQTNALAPPPATAAQQLSLDGVPSPLSRATSNVTTRLARSRSVMQHTDRGHPQNNSSKHHHHHHANTAANADEDALDLPLETYDTLIGVGNSNWTSSASQVAGPAPPALLPLFSGESVGTPPLAMPGGDTSAAGNANNLSLALTATSANFTDNNSGTIFNAPFTLTSPDALQPSRGQSFARHHHPPAMEGLGTSMNLASAGSASTLLLKQSYNGQQHAAAATGSHTVAPIMTPEAAAAAAQLRLHATLGAHLTMGQWWDLQQRALTAAAQASRLDRRHQQSHRPSNATTAFGATVQSQMLRSMERSGKYDGHTRSPIVGQPEDGDAPQLLQLFPQDSMNEDDKQPTTMGGGGLLDIEHLASMSLNSPPPPRPATHSLESAGGATGGGGVPHSNTLRPMPTPSTDDLLLESIAPGDSPQHSSQNTTLPPPPPLLPHRSMRQRSGSKVFILHEGEEMLGQSQQHNNNHSADDAFSSPQPLNAVAMAANNAQIGLVSGVVQEFSSFIQQQQQQPYQQQDGVNPSVARRRSTLPTTGTALQQQQQQRPSAENNHHHLHQQQGGVGGALPSSSTSSSTLPALHHEIVLDIAKTSPQHRSLMYTTLRFSRWMASGESSITFVEHTNSSGAGRAARSANIGVGNSSLPLSAAAPTGNPSTAGGASAVSTPPGPSITTASSAWGTGLRGCPLPLPTWHVRQQCSKPIATRATVLSARRVTLTNPAPPFATEELVWMTLSDGTTLKFHHGLTPSLHTPPPAPTLLASKHQVGVGGGETLQGTTASLHQQQHAAEATTTNSAALLPFSHRIPSCGSIVDLGSMAAATAAAVTNPSTTQNGSGFTTAQKKARRADEKLDALQQHVHVEMCTCHPLQTTGAAPSSSAASPMMSLNFPYPHPFTATAQQGNIAAGAAAGTTGGDLHHQRLLAGTPLAEFGRFEDGGGTCDNLSPLSSAYPFQNPPPQAQQHHAQGHQLHASGLDGITNGALFASCDTCGGRVQGKPYAMMSSAFNSVIEHLPLHHMRRSLVIPFSPVNSLSQIMTPNPIITPLSVGEGGSTTAGTTTTRQSVAAASASGRPRYIPLRHVTMTSLYHLLDAYSAHRLREETNSTSSQLGGGGDHPLFTADDAENNNAVGGDEQKHNNFLVVPTANSATTTRRQRTNQIRVADYYDSGGVAFKSEFEGVEATLEDLRKVFSEEDVKGGGESTEALNDADDEEEEVAGGGVSHLHSEQPAVSGGGVGDSGSKQHQAHNSNSAAALAAAASLATRVNLLRLYRAKPQQYLRQLMVLEAQDPSQWISSRTVFAKQLAEWSILQYLFDISCRCPAYFVVDLASGHITQLEVGLHALPATQPTSVMTRLNPDASASGDFRSLPSSAASPSAAASSAATTGPRQFSLGSGEFSATFGGASSIRSNLATRDPTTFRMTTTLQNALPMRSPYSGFLLYASEGLRQAHLVKKELIGLLEYGLEGIRVRQLGQPTTAGQRQRRSGAFLSGRSSPASDFGAGVSASSYRAVAPVSYQTTANDGTPALALPPHARSTPAAVDAMSSARRATAAAIARRVSDSDGGLLSIEPFNSSFADSDQLLLRSNSPPAASGTADRQHSSNPRQPSQRKDDFNEDWAPSSAPSLEADEEGYSIACFDVSSAIVRLNESLSVASSSQTKQHYDPRRGVVVLSSPSLSPPPPKRPATTTTVSDSDAADAKNESLSNAIIPVEASLPTMFPSQPTARGSGVTGAAESSSTTTRSVSPATHQHHLQPPPMLSTSSSGYYRTPYSSSATAHAPPTNTSAAAAHPLTKPLDSFEDFIGCMHSQAATKIQSFVRNRQRCRRLLVAARRLRRRQQQHNTLGAEPPLALDSEDEDEQATISLRTTSSFAGPHQRLFNMSLGSNEGADSRAGGTSGGSFSMMRPRTVSSSLLGQGGGGGSTGHAVGGGHPNSALQSPQLTFQAHLSTPVRQAANNTQSSNNDGDHEGGPEGTLQGEPSAVPQATVAAVGQQQFEEDSPRPCSDVLIPGVTYHAVKTYQQRVESLIEAAVDEGNIAGRGWEHGQPHPWLVWCPFW